MVGVRGRNLKVPINVLDIEVELSIVSSFFCKESQIELSVGFLLIFINRGFLFSEFLQENSPVFQFISGLCLFSHGNPRMIFCFPSPVTNNRVFLLFSKMVRSRSTKILIVLHLFSIPSTLKAFSGYSSCWILKPDFLA